MKEELEKKCYIGKVYSFENFITNESNIDIFELLKNYPNVNMKYNPIVIEGTFGTGKTHLLNAFKNEHSDKYNIKVVECFDFAYDLTNNLANKTMKTFLEEYDCADILCIDNILFLYDRETTQEYLLQIIDKYLRSNKQVIITTINSKSISGFLEMLKSRVNCGMKYQIKNNKYEMNITKCLKVENSDLDLDIADYKTILSFNGKIDGIVGSCKIDEFINQLDEPFKDSLSKAKGILIKFSFHKKHSLVLIENYFCEIKSLIRIDTEIIFDTNSIDNINEEILKYEIIVTGL